MALLQKSILDRFTRVSRPKCHRLLLSAEALNDEVNSRFLEHKFLALAVWVVKPISKSLKDWSVGSSQMKKSNLIGTLRVVRLES